MKEGKNKINLVIIAAIIIFAIGGIYVWQTNKSQESEKNSQSDIKIEKIEKNDSFSYSIIDNLVSVSKNETPFDFTANQLKTSADECGINNDSGYFDKLISKFNGSSKIVYNFKYKGGSQDDGVFKVTILPNKAGYTSIDQFKKDFDICSAGGDAYPELVNKDWLLFVSSCGSGFDDGSGRVHGCDEVQKIIEPSLKLN